jgi:hypothetical protein
MNTSLNIPQEGLETLFCQGSAARIRELVYRRRYLDAVGRVNVIFLQPDLSAMSRA